MNHLTTGPRIPVHREIVLLLVAFLIVAGWIVLTAASLARATHEELWTPQTVAPAVTAHIEEAP